MSLTILGTLIVFQFLLILTHAVVYQSLVAAFGIGSPWLAWLFGLLSFTFFIASFSTFWLDNAFVKWFYRFAAFWFGFVEFLFFGAVGFYCTIVIAYGTNNYIHPEFVGAIWFGAFVFAAFYAFWRAGATVVTRVTMRVPHLPESWRGKMIALVTDVHLGAVRGEKFAERVVKSLTNEKPEAVLIAGDMYDGVKCDANRLIAPFRNLYAPSGVFFSSGNHEYIKEPSHFFAAIRGVGITLLHNETREVKGLHFAGVDWKETSKKEQFENVLARMHIDRNRSTILMRHEPSHLDVAARAGVSVVLSGHTHSGQIFPLNYLTKKIYSGFDYGLKKMGEMFVYTSSGVGTWGPPLRFGTKSEIVMITLQ